MWIYLFLGAVQGILEWLPISSQGVTALLSRFLISDFNSIDLALFLHLGTFLAVLIYFRKDWQEIVFLKNKKLLYFLIVATIVSLIVGFPFYKLIKNIAVGNILLIVMGFGLLATAFFHKTKKSFSLGSGKLALIVGFLQGLAVIPGLSRSGATIFGLSLAKKDPEEVLKVSYLMSAPIILVSGVYLFINNSNLVFQAWPALASSFLIGILFLNFLIKAAKKINFFKFALIFSLLCFLGAAIGFLF